MFNINLIKFCLCFLPATNLINMAKATKCGEFVCDENSECQYNIEISKLNCVCQEGFKANVTKENDNFYHHCYQLVGNNDEIKCLNVGDKCGPTHQCNSELTCEVFVDKQLEVSICQTNEFKCFEKCCLENEICFNGTVCLNKEESVENFTNSLDLECLENETKCLHVCCKETEICSLEQNCVPKATTAATNSFSVTLAIPCAANQKCQDICCAENEECFDGIECVAKESSSTLSAYNNCPELQQCAENCCNLNEWCSLDFKCLKIVLDCPESQICQEKCCNSNQTCNDIKGVCVEKDNCPPKQKCLNKCCSENEICSESAECISLILFSCPVNQKCGQQCCLINETCSKDYECLAIPPANLNENCVGRQKCLNKCCEPFQICNDLQECVNKTLPDFTNLNDFYLFKTKNQTITEHDFDAVVPIYDFGQNIKENTSCPADHYPCQHQCCNLKQICNILGECEENVIDTNCDLTGNCLQAANNTFLPYVVIGLGCLISALIFFLFKLHKFRQQT